MPMKLYYGKTSPYVRKVLVAAFELGIESDIERLEILPWDPETTYGDINPLGKIPALVTSEGRLLYDSRVIVEHLDSLSDKAALIPADHDGRMECLRVASLGDGLMEAMILLYSELERRPRDLHWRYWDDRMREKVDRALDRLEIDARSFDAARPDLAQITAACGVGWLGFREKILGIDALKGRPTLARWFAAFARRPSMVNTVPVAH